MSLLLVTADDLDVTDGRVRHRTTGEVIGALYLRLDDELVDVVDGEGRPIGAEVFEVAAAGDVLLANAPGNGVADDKAMYCYVPELIAYYLEERPLLESVPTYRTSDETERRIVLERVGELVTKPVDGHGGRGVLIGPDASAVGGGAAPRRDRRRPGRLGRPGGGGAVVAPDLRRRCAAAPARGSARFRVPSRHCAGRLRARPAGTHPRRPRGQPGRQLLPGRRREGHLDHQTTEGEAPCADSPERSGSTVGRPTSAACERMNDCQEARGPDGSGIWARGPVALGHRRLSIIDLSVAGSQPMVDSPLGLSVVFNGCIYNYQQLRDRAGGRRVLGSSPPPTPR